MVISHDRYFLDRISTHTLAFEDSGQVNFFPGSFSEYAAFMKSEGKTIRSTEVVV
jgi:energy-dependent translational throttle protein EttA